MTPFLRKVPTGSGATAVQIVDKRGGDYRIVEHLGSAHSDEELAALWAVGQEKLHPGQLTLDLESRGRGSPGQGVVKGSRSGVLIDTITAAYKGLGFDIVDDEAFFQLVLARLVEPTSKADSVRVLDELGVPVVHRNTFLHCLTRAQDRDYRSQISVQCFQHSVATQGISLLLYDVTTLYFTAEKEDDLRKVGYSKERRVDPQIVVGLLVDRYGFPLEIACYEGNAPETRTIIPVVKAFQERHGVTNMVVAADAGMLSATNLNELDAAGLKFIVGSRQTKAPHDLASYFQWHQAPPVDGTMIDTITARGRTRLAPPGSGGLSEPVWDPEAYPQAWRAVWQYREHRARRDRFTLDQQEQRAKAIIQGTKKTKKARFVKADAAQTTFDQSSFDKALRLVGFKGYVTNIPRSELSGQAVINYYHDLWQVEQSFRMSKTDLRARPIFHRTRDAIEAHLTVVFTALAVARYLQDRSGQSIKAIVKTLRPLREFTGHLAGQNITFTPELTPQAQKILETLQPQGD